MKQLTALWNNWTTPILVLYSSSSDSWFYISRWDGSIQGPGRRREWESRKVYTKACNRLYMDSFFFFFFKEKDSNIFKGTLSILSLRFFHWPKFLQCNHSRDRQVGDADWMLSLPCYRAVRVYIDRQQRYWSKPERTESYRRRQQIVEGKKS